MRAVAERADVALGTLYRYFPSKIHLLVSALAQQFERAGDTLDRKAIPGDTPADRVMFVLGRTTQTLQREPNLTEALTRAFMFADASVAQEIEVVAAHVRRMLLLAMREPGTPSDVPEPTEEEVAITKVIGDVWLASLVQWVTGRASAARRGDLARRRGPAAAALTPAPPAWPRCLTPCPPLRRGPAEACAHWSRHGSGSAARVSVWAGDPPAPAWFEREADARHYAASTMKLPLLVAAYRLAERGALDLDRTVPVHNEHRVRRRRQSSSRWTRTTTRTTRPGTGWAPPVDLRTLARHAVVKSGNLATNLLLEHVGTAEVAAVLRDAGCSPATVLPRGIEDAAAREPGLDNLVTAADLARVIGGVAARTLAGADTCAAVEAVLAAQEHRDQVPAGLPEGTYVANKTGWVDGVAHDVALVRPGRRRAVRPGGVHAPPTPTSRPSTPSTPRSAARSGRRGRHEPHRARHRDPA